MMISARGISTTQMYSSKSAMATTAMPRKTPTTEIRQLAVMPCAERGKGKNQKGHKPHVDIVESSRVRGTEHKHQVYGNQVSEPVNDLHPYESSPVFTLSGHTGPFDGDACDAKNRGHGHPEPETLVWAEIGEGNTHH